MSTYDRLVFMSKLHREFRHHAFQQIIGGNLWDTGTWAYLMGGEL